VFLDSMLEPMFAHNTPSYSAMFSHVPPLLRLLGLAGSGGLLVLLSLCMSVAGTGLDAHISRSVAPAKAARQAAIAAKPLPTRLERVRERLANAEAKATAAAAAAEQAQKRHVEALAHVEAVRQELADLEAISEADELHWKHRLMRKDVESMLQVSSESSLLLGASGDDFSNWDEFEDSTFNPNGPTSDPVEVIGPNVTYNVTASTPGHPAVPIHGRVPIHVYYESRCPYSLDFLSSTLFPLWNNEELRAYLDFKLYPYGNAVAIPNANISEGYKFWHPEAEAYPNIHVCQHGPEECLGNTIQACLLKKLDPDKSLAVIFCMADAPSQSIEMSSFECMKKHDVSLEVVAQCANGGVGNSLMTTNGERTRAAGVTQTPWVLINTTFANASDESGSLSFFDKVCLAIVNMTDEEAHGDNATMPSSCSSTVNDVHNHNVSSSKDLDHENVDDFTHKSFVRIHVPMGASLAVSRPFTSYADAEGGYRPVMITMQDSQSEMRLPEDHEDLAEPSDA